MWKKNCEPTTIDVCNEVLNNQHRGWVRLSLTLKLEPEPRFQKFSQCVGFERKRFAQCFEITKIALYFASFWSSSTRMVFSDWGIITEMLLTWTWSETNTLCRKCAVWFLQPMGLGKLISQSELYDQSYLASDSTLRDHCSTTKWRKFKLCWHEVKDEAKRTSTKCRALWVCKIPYPGSHCRYNIPVSHNLMAKPSY